MEECLELGDSQMRLVEPADVDAVMDMYIKRGPCTAAVHGSASASCILPLRELAFHVRAGQGDRDPYWSRPWPAATALARELLLRPDLAHGRRVCEIGAGLGIASIAAAMAGALASPLVPSLPGRTACMHATLWA
jgi:hypothetical protein